MRKAKTAYDFPICVAHHARLDSLTKLEQSLAMKKNLRLFLLSSAFLALAQLSYAGASNKSGNPFGNGSLYNTSGTFSAVLRGVNIVGITQFSTATTNSLTGNPLYIYSADLGAYDDGLFVYATLDPSANSISAFIEPTTNTPFSTTQSLSAGGGSFTAALSSQPPNQTLSGTGNLTEIMDSTLLTPTNIPFSITGSRISN